MRDSQIYISHGMITDSMTPEAKAEYLIRQADEAVATVLHGLRRGEMSEHGARLVLDAARVFLGKAIEQLRKAK